MNRFGIFLPRQVHIINIVGRIRSQKAVRCVSSCCIESGAASSTQTSAAPQRDAIAVTATVCLWAQKACGHGEAMTLSVQSRLETCRALILATSNRRDRHRPRRLIYSASASPARSVKPWKASKPGGGFQPPKVLTSCCGPLLRIIRRRDTQSQRRSRKLHSRSEAFGGRLRLRRPSATSSDETLHQPQYPGSHSNNASVVRISNSLMDEADQARGQTQLPSEPSCKRQKTRKEADPRTLRACQNCRNKKVKCSGTCPCQYCEKRGISCMFSGFDNDRVNRSAQP